jgi:hypothetical protein
MSNAANPKNELIEIANTCDALHRHVQFMELLRPVAAEERYHLIRLVAKAIVDPLFNNTLSAELLKRHGAQFHDSVYEMFKKKPVSSPTPAPTPARP